MVKNKQRVDQLHFGIRSLLAKNGYMFSEEDKALLEEILVQLEEMSKNEKDEGPIEILRILSLVMKFFEISELF